MVKECGATVVNWGSLSRPVCWDSSQNIFVFGDKDIFFLQIEGGHLSQEGSITFLGKKGEGGGEGGQSHLLALLFSPIPSA